MSDQTLEQLSLQNLTDKLLRASQASLVHLRELLDTVAHTSVGGLNPLGMQLLDGQVDSRANASLLLQRWGGRPPSELLQWLWGALLLLRS